MRWQAKESIDCPIPNWRSRVWIVVVVTSVCSCCYCCPDRRRFSLKIFLVSLFTAVFDSRRRLLFLWFCLLLLLFSVLFSVLSSLLSSLQSLSYKQPFRGGEHSWLRHFHWRWRHFDWFCRREREEWLSEKEAGFRCFSLEVVLLLAVLLALGFAGMMQPDKK